MASAHTPSGRHRAQVNSLAAGEDDAAHCPDLLVPERFLEICTALSQHAAEVVEVVVTLGVSMQLHVTQLDQP